MFILHQTTTNLNLYIYASRIIVLKNKYIKLTYILGMFYPVMVIFNFCRRLHKFTTCVLSISPDFFVTITY